jgi:hypothetical protein
VVGRKDDDLILPKKKKAREKMKNANFKRREKWLVLFRRYLAESSKGYYG